MNKEDCFILIVEDEDSIRLTLRDFLEKKGYNVLVASDGVGAVKQLLDNDSLVLIITDYRMEVFGGDYWVRFLQKYCSELSVVVTSGFLKPEFDIPFKAFFKPFDYTVLEEEIDHIISNK